jgi:serine/threonine protein kinase
VTFAEGLIGVVLDGRYRLDAVLGEGGMGSVFRATQLAMERKVAVKLLKPHLTSDVVALQRFAAEARRTMRVDSPHAVKVLDFGVTEQRDYYMVLEYLDGRTVQRELEVDGPFSPARVIHAARHALSALGAAHASGLVHRDIKPDNLLLMRVGDDPDFTKVLDFGVAKLMEGAAVSSRSALQLTQQGMVFGTPEFMSPEQACGLPLDGRSDIYALAATMFAMLTGCGLFAASSPIEWLTAHARTPPPHLGAVHATLAGETALDALLQRCLAKRPEQRPQSAAELDRLLAALEQSGGKVAAAPPPMGQALPSTLFSPSSYVEAIAPPDASLDMHVAASDQATTSLRPATQADIGVTTPRRGVVLGLALAGLLAVGGAVVAMTMVAGDRSNAPAVAASPQPSARPAPPPVVADAVPADATTVALAVVDATAAPAPVVIDAAVAATPDAAPASSPPQQPRPHGGGSMNQRVVDTHLRAAREALSSKNYVGELAHAQAALKLDPGNLQAAYYMGDALVSSGDLDHGCEILRNIKRFAPASQRMQLAGCGN